MGSHQKSVSRLCKESSLLFFLQINWQHFGGQIKEGETRGRETVGSFHNSAPVTMRIRESRDASEVVTVNLRTEEKVKG